MATTADENPPGGTRPSLPPDPPDAPTVAPSYAENSASVAQSPSTIPVEHRSHGLNEDKTGTPPSTWSLEGANRLKQGLTPTQVTTATRYYALATKPYPLHADSALRPMSDEESSALRAYVSRELELPAPPTFLTCTASSLTRAAFMAYHQSHIEATLLADVPARARLGRNISRRSILRELVDANGGSDDGKRRMKAFIKAAQRIVFDGHHTLSFVFMSNSSAAGWSGSKLKFRGCSLLLEMAGSNQPGIRTPPQVAQHYALRVLGTTALNAVELVQCFSNIVQDSILDIRHAGLPGLQDADNDYWTVIFSSLECPTALQGVTSLLLGEHEVLIHHFQRAPTVPCHRCYNPNHTQSRCTVSATRLEQTRATRQRRYAGPLMGSTIPLLPDCRDLLALERGIAEYVGAITNGVPLTANAAFLEQVEAGHPSEAETDSTDQRTVTAPDGAGWQVVKRGKGSSPLPAVTEGEPRSSTSRSTNARPSDYQPGRTAAESATQATGGPKRQQARGSKPVSSSTTSSQSLKAQQAAKRYKETCAAYAALEAESDSEDDADDQKPPTDVPASLPIKRVHELETTGDVSTESPADEDIDMDASTTRTRPANAEGPFDGVHSPSSETQPSQEPFWHPASPVTLEDEEMSGASAMPAADEQDDSTSAPGVETNATSAEVRIEKVVAATSTDTHTIDEWIASLNGAHVLVPANGQCIFSALYATTTNLTADRLTFTAEVTRQINLLKRAVIDVVLSNLRYDVQLKHIDPVLELQRLYPDDPPPTKIAAATAALYAHYAAVQRTSVTEPVPQAFWEGTHVLRAMAVYLREPLYVWDVAADNTAHVQQYSYRVFDMPNGDKHETGTVHPIDDSRARDFLELCFHHHVVPPMLLLKHTENHFYGVQHGSWFTTWDNEDGPTMRNRLDLVHKAMNWPPLDAAPYELTALHDAAVAEEAAILEEVGFDVYASGSQETDVREILTTVTRQSPGVDAMVHPEVYRRILATANIDDALMADRRKARNMHRDNQAAAERWKTLHGAQFAVADGNWVWADRITWLCVHPLAFRSLLAYVPFPELIAQQCTSAQLSQWGRTEVYLQQIQMLRRICADDEHDDATRRFCTAWVQACDGEITQTNLALAKDSDRWRRLGRMVDSSLLRNRPVSIDTEQWEILHLIPFAIRGWSQTVMGRANLASRAIWYTEFPQVEKLCSSIAYSHDWSGALDLLIGLARTDTNIPNTGGVVPAARRY